MNSRQKGAQAEREIAHLFNTRRHGHHQSQRNHQSADVDHPTLHIEVKRREEPFRDEWASQAKTDCPDHKRPVVVYRRSRTPWRIRLDLGDLIPLTPGGPKAIPHPMIGVPVDLDLQDFIQLTQTRLP